MRSRRNVTLIIDPNCESQIRGLMDDPSTWDCPIFATDDDGYDNLIESHPMELILTTFLGNGNQLVRTFHRDGKTEERRVHFDKGDVKE